MKKIIAGILSLCLLLSLCACGAGTQAAPAAQATPEPTPEPTPTPAPYAEALAKGQKYYYCLDDTPYDKEKAIEYFTQAAGQGSGLACWYLGNLVQCSAEDDRFERAMDYYTQAVDLGCPLGLLGQGGLYERGQGAEQDRDKAKALYEQALAEGCVEANCALGDCYTVGSVDRDDFKAEAYYQKALDSEELAYRQAANRGLGNLYEYWADKEDICMDCYDKAVDLGDGKAMFWLGQLSYFGSDNLGLEQDYVKAAEWYEKSMAVGNSDAIARMSMLYKYGRGVETDTVKARELREKAAENGSVSGMTLLGADCYDGSGGDKDLAAAVYWFERVAESKDPDYGISYFGTDYGLGVHAMSCYTSGYIYEKGLGVEADATEALRWYDKALGIDAELQPHVTERVRGMIDQGLADEDTVNSTMRHFRLD